MIYGKIAFPNQTQQKQIMHARTAQLHKIMADHKIKAPEVARLLGRLPITVYIWRCEETKRVIPEDALKRLEFELASKATA